MREIRRSVKLGEVADIRWGDTSTTKASYVPAGFLAYSATGPDGFLDHFDHQGPGIVLSAIGAQCGKSWFADGHWSCIKNTIYVKGLPEHADTRFLFYATSVPDFWPKRGAAQPFISQGDARAKELLLPSLATQRRIASILGAYDDLIELNRRRITLLEEIARGLFEEWFVHFRFPGHDNLGRAETPEGLVPDGWRRVRFDQLAREVRDGISPAEVPAETPYVGLEHIPRRSVTLDAWGRADEVVSTKLRFRRGDVLFGKIRPYFHKVAWAPFDGVSSSDAIVFRASAPGWAGLVLAVASSAQFVAHAVQTSNGTKMPRANSSVLAGYPVPVPPEALLLRFNEAVIGWTELAATLNATNRRLAASRDLLLPRLISGNLSIAVAERVLENAA